MRVSLLRSVLPFFLMSSAFAEEETVVGEGKRSCKLSQKPEAGLSLKSFCGIDEPRCGCFAKNCSDTAGMAFQLDVLWWRAENHGFSVGLNESSDGQFNPNIEGSTNIGTILRVHPKWDPGLKLGVGWNADYDRWELFANWTWYRNHSRTTTVRSDIARGSVSNDGLYPFWPVADTSLYGPYRRAFSSWRMLYSAVDLELGRPFFMTDRLTLNPQLGVRCAWIHQRFRADFMQFLQTAGFSKQEFSGKEHWWGVGPRAGIQSDWLVGGGLRIIGSAAASLLYGKTSVRFFSQKEAVGSDVLTVDRRFIDSFYAMVPSLQIFGGLGWGQCFLRDKLYVAVDAGWEVNYWWNQFNLPVGVRGVSMPLPTVGNQPVTMEGLTMTIHLDY